MSVRETEAHHYAKAAIVWESTSDAEFPYRAQYNGTQLVLRVNDFPAEPLFTLLVDGKEAADYEDWSPMWSEAKNLAVA